MILKRRVEASDDWAGDGVRECLCGGIREGLWRSVLVVGVFARRSLWMSVRSKVFGIDCGIDSSAKWNQKVAQRRPKERQGDPVSAQGLPKATPGDPNNSIPRLVFRHHSQRHRPKIYIYIYTYIYVSLSLSLCLSLALSLSLSTYRCIYIDIYNIFISMFKYIYETGSRGGSDLFIAVWKTEDIAFRAPTCLWNRTRIFRTHMYGGGGPPDPSLKKNTKS